MGNIFFLNFDCYHSLQILINVLFPWTEAHSEALTVLVDEIQK